jgi:hypothetical protein
MLAPEEVTNPDFEVNFNINVPLLKIKVWQSF